ncbi:crossover junction endodeoxyribonuclease RuvC [Candidatus Daviesbacteria bacterium RIFCSPHIGHO2_01_FULL_44_29]|uniref:Crossover junction endodeoxyribonuclease RuvC n=1 Tax=Candidatus Daviesbacteria bacterium RIFCSPHIGHO2_02_FULL_43_12 TaxID=1797776 RepID=A0A1F5KKQ3_9BACT|nr:MAG: crossover junction endodeoxyribonuclease RuvC [Candidatus Daviesbacteria bacterium RIFCSPHIGHO2_01_FULL_44_29]OGE40774.1 MAG: crossover junction endodeoxyribonuclease RuvC [Candidatus Daviesbacteria bacterium RIFCSPHIGHO2_12_FULL_47_45]OGE41375.1 MAG: crossover junction endodeoxyribonuclease RuvC [Candidatus Daviesbacteria bacterium RIFCSPHIGHO2_02_FULL_43_12]OGE69576.1 MAG: crossover junction endodeoxyribonuclease RuvC [Candidatus Daviesbacteria bacterium RIFCSPLOWO2_01_FULL_43_15]
MIILGIDPGISRIGWGLVEELKGRLSPIKYGCLETSPKHSEESRLLEIHIFFSKLIAEFNPDIVSLEQLFFAANTKTAFSVGQARGVLILTMTQKKIPIQSFTPLQVKLAICGYGRAEKKQIQQMVKALLNLTTIPEPDDAADALAIALTFAFSYKLDKKLI